MTQLTSFEHQILIAMPSLDDSWFEKTVIYIVEDNEHGSMGLVLNLPHKLDVEQLLSHFNINKQITPQIAQQRVLMGGPVDMEHGFLLHKGEAIWQKSLSLKDGLAMTVSDDLLQAIGQNKGPDKFIAALGFAGWEKGQLAKEIQENSWLSIPYNESLIFDVKIDEMWLVSLQTLGISPEFLSMEAGYDC